MRIKSGAKGSEVELFWGGFSRISSKLIYCYKLGLGFKTLWHIRSGFVNRHTHFIRNGDYITANGDVVNAEVWQLPSVTMGPKTIYNVEIAVMPGIEETGFLLGMSTINKLGNPKIDLTNNKIIIN